MSFMSQFSGGNRDSKLLYADPSSSSPGPGGDSNLKEESPGQSSSAPSGYHQQHPPPTVAVAVATIDDYTPLSLQGKASTSTNVAGPSQASTAAGTVPSASPLEQQQQYRGGQEPSSEQQGQQEQPPWQGTDSGGSSPTPPRERSPETEKQIQYPPAAQPPLQQQGANEGENSHVGIKEEKAPSRARSRIRSQSTFIPNNTTGHSPSRRQSRPLSMVQTYQPPVMDINEDTIPEMLPIFTFLNSHANKLYQEGYFLKLDDQNTQGRTNPDRRWTECFAQLVGTVMSLWDAAELDAAGEDGEVLPKFINITDASIQMIDSLPTKSENASDQPLQNILSISTAGRNRYLFHFNSRHSLLQWTAGIRLAMYEQATLQEAYTGALIAGKGKSLNNINLIMERERQRVEVWVRVRFGAGTPWRRCYCVITPPDEKEYQKMQKEWKKRSTYDRSGPPALKGNIKFYDTKLSPKKQKKATPLATITDSYSAYAIYPQAKPLMDASTLVKIEGNITYYLDPPSSKEGFVFVMPEVPAAVSGFEMLLRFLFPTWDTFNLYGRPGRLVASVLDQRSLMFAMPKTRRYGYLEVLDVTSLLLAEGGGNWTEQEWRRKMKELTSSRLMALDDTSSSTTHSRSASRTSNRLGTGSAGAPASTRPRVNFSTEVGPVRAGRSMTVSQAAPRIDSAPLASRLQAHTRNSSDPHGMSIARNPLGYGADFSPSQSPARDTSPPRGFRNDLASTPEGQSSDEEIPQRTSPVRELKENVRDLSAPEPVTAPPAFSHAQGTKPNNKPYHSPELRKANSRLSHTTLSQIISPQPSPMGALPMNEPQSDGVRWENNGSHVSNSGPSDRREPAVHSLANPVEVMANTEGPREALSPPSAEGANVAKPLPRFTGPPYEQDRVPQVVAQALTTDSHSLHSSPRSRSNSMGSQKYHPAFHRPFTPPIPSPTRPMLAYVQTSQPISKTPLPDRAASLKNNNGICDDTPQSGSSISSFADLVIDPDALDMICPPGGQGQGLARHDTERSEASSNYDNASTTSPDYASTVQSDDTTHSADRPRAGVLRTVGDVNHQQVASNAASFPDIDFGPTLTLSGGRGSHQTSPSQGSLTKDNTLPIGDYGHSRQASNDTVRKIAWHAAGTSVGAGAPARAMSPEEFVQQRAAQTPTYQHQRQVSGNTLRGNTPTPPLNPTVIYDQVSRQVHSRNNSADLLQRPSSRGAGSVLNVGSSLSAREQEQVARMTGSSLLQVDGRRPSAQSAGLVGAIAQREREKQQMMQGFGNQAVHQAIHQRQQAQVQQAQVQQAQVQQAHLQQQLQQQQQQQQQQTQHQLQQQMYQQSVYGMSNASSPSIYAGMPQQTQPRQPYGAPSTHIAAQAYSQGGGWARPNMNQGGSRGTSPPAFTPTGQSVQGGRGYFPPSQFQGQAL